MLDEANVERDSLENLKIEFKDINGNSFLFEFIT